jgi:hypothetical protein
MRPCHCNRLPPDGEPYTTAYCRPCYLAYHSPEYRALWGPPAKRRADRTKPRVEKGTLG